MPLMPPTPSSKTRISRTTRPARGTAAWIAVPLLAMSSGAAAQEQTASIWKAQEINFTYSSSTSIYSCGALRSRVVSMLRAVGAHEDLKVSVNGCDEFLFPEPASTIRSRQPDLFGNFNRDRNQFASVHIRLRSPIEATPDAIAELEKTKGYRELLGRVTNSSAAIQEAAAQFPAQRQLISLSYKSLRLEPEECELIEQMIRDVFPKLGVRVVESSMTCIPRQVSLLKPRLKVEALIRTPLDDASAQQAPAAVPPAESAEPSTSDAGLPASDSPRD